MRHVQIHMQVSLQCAIYYMCEIIVFSLVVMLLLYIPCKKFFIEGFFVEDYLKEIENVINCIILEKKCCSLVSSYKLLLIIP